MAERGAILVSGAAGYIGSHACKALAQRGYLPVGIDDYSRGWRGVARFGPLIEADIGDSTVLASLLDRWQPRAVMHFAGRAYVPESVIDPWPYWRANVHASLSLFHTLRSSDRVPVIYSSTCATYGLARHLPITEDHPQDPLNPYGQTKLVVEQALSDLARSDGWRVVALRYFNVAGADPEGECGEFHFPEPHLIPRTLLAGMGALPAIDVAGLDWPTPDGSCVRDYIHVCDLVDAHLLALERALASPALGFEAFNLGYGRGLSVLEIIAAAGRVLGRSIPTRVVERRPGDAPMLFGCADRARKLLGFEPRFDDIDVLIDSAYRHFRSPAYQRAARDRWC